jgi:hypothetical protein
MPAGPFVPITPPNGTNGGLDIMDGAASDADSSRLIATQRIKLAENGVRQRSKITKEFETTCNIELWMWVI